MEQNLVGYLLKALDDDTQRQVENSLRQSPELRSSLEVVERALAPLAADRDPPTPRPGLVLSTLARIAEHHCRKLPDAPPPPRNQTTTPTRHWLRRPDVLVAAMVMVLLGGIGSSYLVHLWREYDGRSQCRNNLYQIWAGLQRYCDVHEGNFPRVQESGARAVAGTFVPSLRDSGMLTKNVSFSCPAKDRRSPSTLTMAELERLYAKDAEAFRQEARKLSGDYAYTLGYYDEAGLHGLRCDSGDLLPIVADMLESPLTQRNSFNHGGQGQNVLYLGGNVDWRTTRNAGMDGDDIFVNRDNRVLAGKALEDSVLAPGDASPTPRK